MRRLQFADFELDLKRFTLRQSGKLVEIGPRTLDLLICLIENRDRVVDHEFLRREVWNSTALSPAAIPTCIRELRRLLGDDARQPSFIESKRGRGYRFIANLVRTIEARQRLRHPLEELPFVGRTDEIRIVRDAIRTCVTQAAGRLILIRGEAGIGKSRLLTQILDNIAPNISHYGMRGSNIEGTPPFWPWTQVVRAALTRQKKTNPELIANAQALSSAFPEIQGSVDPTFARVAKLDRFSVLSQWARTIRSLSPSMPLLLAFEDIHRTDIDSLSLLAWLVEELASDPVIILATHRPSPGPDEAAQALSDIASIHNCVSIDLPPLTAKDISLLLDPLDVDRDSMSEALRTRTSGNPFYVTHLIRYLDSQTDFGSAESLISALPSNGREIVSHQLSDLPHATRQALSVASVAGGTFSITTTAAALTIGAADLVSQLEPARRAWLIRETGTDYVFSHALLREALYQTMDSGRRRLIHHEIAKILIGQSNSISIAAQVSDHLMNALPLADADQARRFAVIAGREAFARFAYSEAQVYFRRALNLTEAIGESEAPERCKVMLEYASAQLYEGNRSGARTTLLSAAEIARSTNSPSLLAQCALDLAPDFLSIIVGAYDLTLVHLIEEALDATPVENQSLRAKLLARLSQAIQWSGDRRSHANMTTRALDLARRSKNREALGAALSARAEFLRGPAGATDRLDVLAELDEISRANCSAAERLMQKTQMITALLEIGDLKRLDAENEVCRELASRTGLPHFMWHAESKDSMRALMRGVISERSSLSERFHEVQRLTKDENVTQEYAAQEIYRQVENDRSSAVLPFARDFAQKQESVLTWSAALCWIQWDANEIAESLETIDRLGQSGIEAQSRETGGGIGIAGLAEVVSHVGDLQSREQLYRILSTIRSRYASAGYGWLYFGSFARYSGLLASSLNLHRNAVDDLELAIAAEAKLCAPVWQGYALVDLVEVLRRAQAPDSEVSRAINEARTLAKRVNSPRLTRRFLQVLERVPLGYRSSDRETKNNGASPTLGS